MIVCTQQGDQLLNHEWSSFPFDYEAFVSSRYGERLRYHLNRERPEMYKNSIIHGISHAERVVFLAAIIAWAEGLEDVDTIILAGLYHDIGRHNDATDPDHGRRSAEILKASGMDNDLLFQIVKYHSHLTVESLERGNGFLRYLYALMDADALDRVRLSSRCECAVLKNASAKMMRSFANEVFSKYWQPQRFYYHCTRPQFVDSILANGFRQRSGKVYFAETKEDCLQLAPLACGLWGVKNLMETMSERMRRPAVTKAYNLPMLTVDLSGIADRLWMRVNGRAEDVFLNRTYMGVYEFLLFEPVPPERIIRADSITMTIVVPEIFADKVDDIVKGIYE